MFFMRFFEVYRCFSPPLLVGLLAVLYGPRLSAQDNTRTPELQKELEQLASDFNLMYRERTPILVALTQGRCRQTQTFLGIYEKTPEGDYAQQNLLITTVSGGVSAVGTSDGEQRLTIESGRIVVIPTYRPKGGGLRVISSAAVERLGNGIIFREFRTNGTGAWNSNEFYIKRDGRHETVRRFKDDPQNDDLFAEVDTVAK